MNYGNIKECDIADGPGVRVSLFVSGCRHHCKGCFNEETWNFNYGQPYTEETEAEILNSLDSNFIQGFTLLGGEPFDMIPGGCVHTNVTDEMLSYIDVLVDGEFKEALKDVTLVFRGSQNQRIINVKESKKQGKVVLEDY